MLGDQGISAQIPNEKVNELSENNGSFAATQKIQGFSS
jgi:hypothetical protein